MFEHSGKRHEDSDCTIMATAIQWHIDHRNSLSCWSYAPVDWHYLTDGKVSSYIGSSISSLPTPSLPTPSLPTTKMGRWTHPSHSATTELLCLVKTLSAATPIPIAADLCSSSFACSVANLLLLLTSWLSVHIWSFVWDSHASCIECD